VPPPAPRPKASNPGGIVFKSVSKRKKPLPVLSTGKGKGLLKEPAHVATKDVLQRLRESEMQVKTLTSKVNSNTGHDPDLLLGRIAELNAE
ncbi:hypothetical protein A2U01_0054932, partial [Trifolium medium]|nr:hypothetical protein [Trifolium medium]